MKLGDIYRYPVKGFTPERLANSTLNAGAGLPYDRCCAFTSGNLPDEPQAGGWVPARTFIQLTVYPELAGFAARLDETDRSIAVIAPNGASATAGLDASDGFDEVNELIRSHFAPGPHAIPELHVQAPGHGHWDFTDTGVSLINQASVADLVEAAGAPVDPRRFRGNLYLDDLPAWAEFGMIGRRYRIGDAEIDVTRPAMRCAATTVDPATADTSLNVPVVLRKLTGHLFCGVYARVAKTGRIAPGDRLQDLGPWDGNPNDKLPPRTPDPREWPRPLQAHIGEEGTIELRNMSESWPLMPGATGDEVRIHPVSGRPEKMIRLTLVQDSELQRLVCAPAGSVDDSASLLVSGPYSV